MKHGWQNYGVLSSSDIVVKIKIASFEWFLFFTDLPGMSQERIPKERDFNSLFSFFRKQSILSI